MGQKWPKIAIFCQKMVQMTSNLDIWCIYIVFIKSQNFENFRLFLAVFWSENRIFFNFRGYVLKKNFGRNIFTSLENGPIGLKIGIHAP